MRGHETGVSVVDGIAIGRAVRGESDPPPSRVARTVEAEHVRLARALRQARDGVEELIRFLSPAEADLFLPEIEILEELGPLMSRRVNGGSTAEEAVYDATSPVSTDLLLDARARLLDGLGNHQRSVETRLESRAGDRVLVTESLTPSVVAVLPVRVVGIVAAFDGTGQTGREPTSHAVILARGRRIPLALVPPRVVLAIADDDMLVVDTTGRAASLWLTPDESVVAEARRRFEELLAVRAEEEVSVAAPLAHLGLEVHVNVGSIHERIPTSTEGIGLLRTELLFSAHTLAPSEAEQLDALRVIAGRVAPAPVVVRLFDAGGDKPLEWLQAPGSSPLARGIGLLFMHPEILDAQLRVLTRMAEHVDVRVLLPLVRCAGDVERIRALSDGRLSVGAMIETPEAVDHIDEIAAASDFLSIGTNDLFAIVSGQDRAHAPSLDARGLRMIERVIEVAHSRGRKVSVCGEMAGDPQGARILVGLGIDAISVTTARFAKVKLSLREVSTDDCRGVARAALLA
jgi:phosphocarrier protein FPr